MAAWVLPRHNTWAALTRPWGPGPVPLCGAPASDGLVKLTF